MDYTYESGFQIAFMIGLLKFSITIAVLFSTRAKNMAKVGIYLSLFNGTFSSFKENNAKYLIWYAFYMLALAPLFSWLSVASAVFYFAFQKLTAPPVPDSLKEIQYRVATIEMSKIEMLAVIESTKKILSPNLTTSSERQLDLEDSIDEVRGDKSA